ncbi:helix-turn-helix domain-containing protein [Paraburkholderia sp. SIMBA_055]|uniref:Transcriptional regulator with XRE-family HTH domain n=1 Tax=Paraburkholderia graminis TaxID=60548 RepID=A0ABD5CN24_9BURK|nr:helix-turn-helix domain-containing protein [Paraburkholderia graminis]AXF07976.1 transcriptional regulator [Paraburkholderia graminis]MDQ0623146.1 transcriptional regulator with XRE-family HTH domain [Paraburkholderia graminis]MDR6206652.1 transcriptional regulator with XRE-family HTH domain [Paraburkholderia graminis]
MRESGVLITDIAQLGELARASRLAQGLTRDDVALATGLSPKFISHIEAGKTTAQIGKVLHLLGELGITLRAETPVNLPAAAAAGAPRRRRSNRGG